MDVKVKLILYSFDPKSSTTFVVNNDGLPVERVTLSTNVGDLLQLVHKIVADYINLSPEWVDSKLLYADYFLSSEVHIYYAAWIPHDTTLLQGRWLPIINCENPIVQKVKDIEWQ